MSPTNTETEETSKLIVEFDEYLKNSGIVNFTAREVCTLKRFDRAVMPQKSWWPRIVPTLWLCEQLRTRLEHPLVIGNGYRPKDYNSLVGGARNSQHIHFRAVDIDLPKHHRTAEHQEAFYTTACELFLEHGSQLKVGLGLYRPWRGTRVHIDTGYVKRYWHAKFVEPILNGMR